MATIHMTASVTQLTEQALARASADRWHCLTHVPTERALRQARRLDAQAAIGSPLPPLAGVPFVAKSLFQVRGVPCQAGGSDTLQSAPAENDARLVQQLSDAGAVLVGIADMDEFACGFLGQNPHRVPVVNPRNPKAVSGGSSSGSAAAVASHIVPLAIGSDTNGSVRVPAAFCGIYSLKPTYGLLPLEGSISLAPSLDHAGFLAASVDLLQTVWQTLHPSANPAPQSAVRPGFASGDYHSLSDATTRNGLSAARAVWPGAPLLPFTHAGHSLAAASLITAVEAHRTHRAYLDSTPARYSPALAKRLAAGGEISNAAYEAALRCQQEIRATILGMMNDASIDVLVAPVTPLEGIGVQQARVRLADVHVMAADAAGLFTRPFSLAGFPVLTTPAAMAWDPQRHIPALQLIARPGEEHLLFEFARCIAQLFPHLRTPGVARP